MSRFVASLPMYDWPELRSSVDAEWAELRGRLLGGGVEAPAALTRRNADLPQVPGGVRDAASRVIAPDPATLPPDGFDLAALWRHPRLLVAQTCWGPMEAGLAEHVEVVGQPSYAGIEGGQGPSYSSAIIMRRQRDDDGESGMEWQRRATSCDVDAPADGGPRIPAGRMRGLRLACNVLDSMSGIIALSRDLETLGENIGIFGERVLTGSHRASIAAVAAGKADVCAVDCRSWKIAKEHEPASAAVEVVGWTSLRKGLPMIASRHLDPAVLKAVRVALSAR
jgi:ABC-type phosphate/phosphonate transport system substrate-binding protein